MPVYEYKCSGGHFYEKTEGFDAPNKHRCPSCGKTASRQLSLPAVIFKGSGFYSTDNRNGSRRNGGSDSSEKSDSSAPSKEARDHSQDNGHGHPHGSAEKKSGEKKVEASVD